jgi:hypothetical protein
MLLVFLSLSVSNNSYTLYFCILIDIFHSLILSSNKQNKLISYSILEEDDFLHRPVRLFTDSVEMIYRYRTRKIQQ